MKTKAIARLGFSFVLCLYQSAQTAESPSTCTPTTYRDLIKCAETNSTDIQVSEQELKSSLKLEEVAGQWINPDLEADHVTKGSKNSETTVSLLFTIRLGGKKSARLAEAQSEIEKAQASRDLQVHQSRLELMLAAYRLVQIKSEIHLAEETIQTFSKIINQYQNRPALSPEQKVSLSIFKMALSDHKLQMTKLKSDEEKLYQAFTAVTGIPKMAIEQSLPVRKRSWPQLETSNSIVSAPQLKQAAADLKLAKNQKQVADSEAWSDLRLGPAVRTTQDAGTSTTYVGMALAMPIPIFSRNEGSRRYQTQKVHEAELKFQQSTQKLQAIKNHLLIRYNTIVESLKNAVSVKAMNDKHEEIERQFFKGVIPSSLMIEAHRQLFDLEESLNASELEALEAYGQILILDGQFNGVIL